MRLFISIFLAVGLGLLAGAFYSFDSTRAFIARSAAAEGVVAENRFESGSSSNSSGSYHAHIKFTTGEGREVMFRSSIGTNPPAFTEGERVKLYYDPKNPSDARVNTFFQLWFLPILLCGMGALFTAIPAAIIWGGARSKRRAEQLRQSGERVNATYVGVEVDTSLSVNGRHPYVISSQWLNPRTNQVHIFRSERLWYNPEDYVRGKSVPVYVDRNDASRYFVDLSMLPKPA